MSESGIFKAAVKLSPERRAAYLDQACGSNARAAPRSRIAAARPRRLGQLSSRIVLPDR